MLLDRLEVGVLHGVLRCNTLGMVIFQHFCEHVEGLLRHEVLVLAVHEFVPWLLGVLPEDVVVVGVQGYVVLVDVGKQLVSAEHLGDLHELVVVILALEEGLLLEDHTCEHAAE